MVKRRVLFLRSNPVDPDPRVEKAALALKEAGYEIRVLGWDRTGVLPRLEESQFGVLERIALPAGFGRGLRNLPALLHFQVRLFRYLWHHRKEFDVIHACDFDTILPALLIARIFHKKLVYDVFDFYADMIRHTPSMIRNLVRLVDITVMGWADAVILADESRAQQIHGANPKRLEFVYNSPDIREAYPCPPPPPPLRIAYVGQLQLERGIMHVLTLMERHPEWQLDLAGYGGDEDVLLARAQRINNVIFHGRVSYRQALELNAQAHVLFATYDPTIPNHRYSSANKLFEAMALGRPIVVARGTGMDRLVERYGLGFVVEYGNLDQLESAFTRILRWDESERTSFAHRVKDLFRNHFAWPKMADRLRRLYACLLQDHES